MRTVNTYADFVKILKNNMDSAMGSLQAALQNFNNIIIQYNKCSSWSSQIKYDPDVYYDYGEVDYMRMISNYGEMEETVSSPNNYSWYCNSSVSANGTERKATLSDTNYNSCNGSSGGLSNTSINYITCNTSGCKTDPRAISNARYMKYISSVTAIYRPATLFYNTYPSGEITTSKNDDNVALENEVPVSLNRKRGIYEYSVNIENLGEYYDSGNIGRYVGGTNAIVDSKKLTYACSYLVNMGKVNENDIACDFSQCDGNNCIAKCVGPTCSEQFECDGINCIAKCVGVGCIYDEGGAGNQLVERTISLNNMFPSDTDSYNWTNDKGKETIKEIETGDYYDDNNDTSGNKIYDSKPILSLTIDPSTARTIKQYNNSVEKIGGYSNDTIYCKAIGNYQEIACYSSFVDELLSGKYGNTIVNNDSLIKDSSYRDNTSSYFKLWTKGISEEDMIGPSWK